MNNVKVGQTYYLVPKTLGAPAICFKQPKVTIARVLDPYVIVQLADGAEHEVHTDNLAHSIPKPSNPRTTPTRRQLRLPEGMEEVTLW